MKTYYELKEQQSKELNDFEGIFFAFNNAQFEKGMVKIGLRKEDTKQIYSIGAGGYILKTRMQAFKNMFDRHSAEKAELKKDRKLLLDALIFELNNHEYCITWDISDALEALELKKEDIDPAILKKACKIASQAA